MSLLNRIQNAGFAFMLCDGCFEISPASRLNQHQRDFLKLRKDEIIAELQAETSTVSVTSIDHGNLSADDHQLILNYMAAIDETEQDAIDEHIEICRKDVKIRQLTIERATKVLSEQRNADDSSAI
jgi:hypothetical protein